MFYVDTFWLGYVMSLVTLYGGTRPKPWRRGRPGIRIMEDIYT
jgi:hypothetical protein